MNKKNAQEIIDPKEEYFTQSIINILKKSLKDDYANGKMLKRFHPKSHGLLKAEIQVEGNLPESLRVGLFKGKYTYDALIRFSNASPKVSSDYKKGVRGMSIKILIPESKSDFFRR